MPMNIEGEDSCWWVGQWRMCVDAALHFPGHVLLHPDLEVHNPGSSSGGYPTEDCFRKFDRASDQMREALRIRAQKRCTVRFLPQYAPWSTAKRGTKGGYAA